MSIRAASIRAGWLVAVAACMTAVLVGCEGERVQSMLHPEAEPASRVAALWWFMFAVLGAVTLVVFALIAAAIVARRGNEDDPAASADHARSAAREAPWGPTRFIVAGGILLPAAVLVALQFYSISTTMALRQPDEGMTIRVIGHQWWWEVHYMDYGVVTANELHIPAGQPIRLELTSADVIHSFWVPQLHGKRDMIPDHINAFWIQADRAGVYRGQCAEYCGLQHALMAFEVVAMEPVEFEQWIARKQAVPDEPADAHQLRGREVFFEAGCHSCHAIRGTEAVALLGPDLTHIGSRRTLGAGTVANTHGNLAGWIANPQPIKPGNLMPPSYIESQDMQALVDYLRSLE